MRVAKKGSVYTKKLVQPKEVRSKVTASRGLGAGKKAMNTQVLSSNEIFQIQSQSYSAAKIDSKQLQRNLRNSTQKSQPTGQAVEDYTDSNKAGALAVQKATKKEQEPLSATNSSLNNRSSAFEVTQTQRAPDRAHT